MTQQDMECVERTVQAGDTVVLEFVGPGVHREEPLEHVVGASCFWSALLVGQKVGKTVTLPEGEGNEVYALIRSIDR